MFSVISQLKSLSGLVAVILLLALSIGGALWFWRTSFAPSPQDLLTSSRSAYRSGAFARAEALAARALDQAHEFGEAAWLAGECASRQKNYQRAAEYLQKSTTADPIWIVRNNLLLAEIEHRHLTRLQLAESAYKRVLEIESDHVEANTGLAELLTLCARSREARTCVLHLIRQQVETELLVLLVRNDVVLGDSSLLRRAREADPEDPNPLLALAWLEYEAERSAEAEELLTTALQLDAENLPARLMLGRILLQANRSAEFATWAEDLPAATENVAEAWLLRGQMAESLHDTAGATRCYWEAASRAPESKQATFSLVHQLTELGQTDNAEKFLSRLEAMTELETAQNRVLFTADKRTPDKIVPLAKAYEAAGRLWEAYAWYQFADRMRVATPHDLNRLQQLSVQLQNEPLTIVTDAANIAKTLDLSQYPIPRLSVKSPPQSRGDTPDIASLAFENRAVELGLSFTYYNGVPGPTTHRMFEFTGGGVAVLDYDRDLWPDLFLTQGRDWPVSTADFSHHDVVYRNRSGSQFQDVTAHVRVAESDFGQGATIGDFNTDGFPDVYVANIGSNRLWQNLGDGTFQDVTEASGIRDSAWTTSSLLADLTGDGLPDIYDVNYLTAPDVFDRVCHHLDGSPKACLPHDFMEQPDRLWKNLGDGSFVDATWDELGEIPAGMGLGIAAWDSNQSGQLSVYVANDTTSSFFFQRQTHSNQPALLRECGVTAGLAFNGSGKATGCMGVAVGDVNHDGRMDLLVTNFSGEPNTMFMSTPNDVFNDETQQAGLDRPSFDMLGFGTQFLDGNLDGVLELFVANGHVDDLRKQGRPYRMPAQLFAADDNGHFQELPRAQLGDYFTKDWLGRAVVRWDWNRDGREDLAVGHLYDPLALLTNQTSNAGGYVALNLVGIDSNRDAIGTIVTSHSGSRSIVRQLSAGDGYQCSNHRRLEIGTSTARSLDELHIRWPSGVEQSFLNVAANTEYILREGGQLVSVTIPAP